MATSPEDASLCFAERLRGDVSGNGILLNCFGGSTSTSRKQPSTSVEYLCQRFSLAQLRKSTNDFSESHFLRQGQHGPVYRGSISINGQLKDITVKRLGAGSSKGLALYKNDVLFMSQLHHPNLQPLVGFCDDKNEMIVVYEHAPKTDHSGIYLGASRPRYGGRRGWKSALEWRVDCTTFTLELNASSFIAI
ncbi:probable receptor-like protein kinase At5g38990 [Neltuma alba]|uniref:probable receptor-like protein kinase At5g38990 n=1 Tax=Neltuma alba TaxID=207710 RepID=UPI0010A44A6C|nr:probable receptor-like protein kinase At5g38990 [Prosopis alba]